MFFENFQFANFIKINLNTLNTHELTEGTEGTRDTRDGEEVTDSAPNGQDAIDAIVDENIPIKLNQSLPAGEPKAIEAKDNETAETAQGKYSKY